VLAALTGAAAFGGCAAQHPPAARPPTAPAAAAQGTDVNDWHALVRVPFGTRLQDVPFPLGEVLRFHAASAAPAGRTDEECYVPETGAAPRLFERTVQQYSLCFASDRLTRIEATVSLAPDTAAAQFAAACAHWQHLAAPVPVDHCEAAEGPTRLEARLALSALPATPAVPGTSAVSIVLAEAGAVRE
jgi:hypothetical protein